MHWAPGGSERAPRFRGDWMTLEVGDLINEAMQLHIKAYAWNAYKRLTFLMILCPDHT